MQTFDNGHSHTYAHHTVQTACQHTLRISMCVVYIPIHSHTLQYTLLPHIHRPYRLLSSFVLSFQFLLFHTYTTSNSFPSSFIHRLLLLLFSLFCSFYVYFAFVFISVTRADQLTTDLIGRAYLLVVDNQQQILI